VSLDVLRLALDVYEARLDAESHLPEPARRRAARAAAERVVDAGAPGVIAWIEKNRPRTQVDELRARRLRDLARPYIDAVVRDSGGDVTAVQLVGDETHRPSRWTTVVPWRDRLCALLSDAGLTELDLGAAVGMTGAGAAKAAGRGRAAAAEMAMGAKSAKGAT
jgi:uncharacterized protein YjiS (DUF1127 family)